MTEVAKEVAKEDKPCKNCSQNYKVGKAKVEALEAKNAELDKRIYTHMDRNQALSDKNQELRDKIVSLTEQLFKQERHIASLTSQLPLTMIPTSNRTFDPSNSAFQISRTAFHGRWPDSGHK